MRLCRMSEQSGEQTEHSSGDEERMATDARSIIDSRNPARATVIATCSIVVEMRGVMPRALQPVSLFTPSAYESAANALSRVHSSSEMTLLWKANLPYCLMVDR